MTKTKLQEKKRPGPKPELISLYPLTFDEVLDAALASKPKKNRKEQKDEEQVTKQGKPLEQ